MQGGRLKQAGCERMFGRKGLSYVQKNSNW